MSDKQKDKNAEPEKAPAVVGQLSVSNEVIDFNNLSKTIKSKRAQAKNTCAKDCEDCKDCSSCDECNSNLTAREKAILARKKCK